MDAAKSSPVKAGTVPGTTQKAETIKAVILDYGEVISYTPRSEEWQRMASFFNLDPREFRQLWGKNRLAYDRGDISYQDYWSILADDARARVQPEQLQKVGLLDLEMWGHINSAMVDWVQQLRSSGIKTGLLSNMPVEMIQYSRQNFAWLKHFDHITFSAEVRLVKPEAGIYRHSIEGLGVVAREALFVDDKERNVEGARAVGLKALQFSSVGKFRNDLTMLEFPLLPLETNSPARS
ncbi:MAG TPA: HAD family phosphatase [Terriglobales bacterium]|nr:HAD family phosphatase [Terriglobales bacterium]